MSVNRAPRRPGALEAGKAELGKQRRDLLACRSARHDLHLQPQRHIVDDAPHRVWDTLAGREVIEKRLRKLVKSRAL